MNNINVHVANAKALLSEGFTTKAAQQRAIEELNRAYSKAHGWARDRMIDEAPSTTEAGTFDQARTDFFAARELPFDLHNVRAKHLPILGEYVPGLDNIVSELIELRAEVKAAPVNRAAPKPAPAAAPEEDRMTCQICGRPIHAGSGKIAHHGYQRPGYGYQTSSCPGALQHPFEVSRDELGRYIEALNRRHDLLVGQLEELHHEQLESFTLGLTDYDAPRLFDRRPVKHITFTASNFEELSAEHAKTFRTYSIRSYTDAAESFKQKVSAEVRSILAELAQQDVRYEAWVETHRFTGEGFEAL